jgi:hypothetical protein
MGGEAGRDAPGAEGLELGDLALLGARGGAGGADSVLEDVRGRAGRG